MCAATVYKDFTNQIEVNINVYMTCKIYADKEFKSQVEVLDDTPLMNCAVVCFGAKFHKLRKETERFEVKRLPHRDK